MRADLYESTDGGWARAGLLEASELRLAPDLRVVAARGGAIVSTSRGCFLIKGQSATQLLSDILPTLYRSGPERLPPNIDLDSLVEAGIIELSAVAALDANAKPPGILHFAIANATALTRRIANLLLRQDFWLNEVPAEADFVVADLSDLDGSEALKIVKDLHRSRLHSISIWKRGGEVILGPLSFPGSTACWHCARLRIADTPDGKIGTIPDDIELARAVAENLVLMHRFPDIAGYGCLLVMGESDTVHSVSTIPWCATCGGGIGASRWAPLNQSPHIPANFRSLADPRTGVIRHLYLFDASCADLPAMPICASAVMATIPLGHSDAHSKIQGEGKGATRETAVLSAIGEGVERYSASLWALSELTVQSPKNLGDLAFDPEWLVLYDEEQYGRNGFAYKPIDRDRPIHWAKGRWLDTGTETLVPAQATYFDFSFDGALFVQTTSSGLAAGRSLEDATLRALYELIERDAFMSVWLSHRHGHRISPSGCDAVCALALSEARRLGAEIELYLLDEGIGIPTVVCLGIGDGLAWPGVTIGLGTHADIDVAVRKAVLEHGHCGPFMRRLMREGRHEKVNKPNQVLTSLDHGLYYCHASNTLALHDLRESRVSVNLPELRKQYHEEATLSACVARLSLVGIRTAAVDVTTTDISPTGTRVVRAFGTQLQPIHFGFGYERRNNPRLQASLTEPIQTVPHPLA